MLLTSDFTFNFFAVAITLITAVIAYLKWNLTYWTRIGLPTINPGLIYGDAADFFQGRMTFGQQIQKLYQNLKSRGYQHGGIYMGPQKFYLPIDLELIKHIMQKDFQHFVNHGTYFNEKNDPLSAHLFNLKDQKWRNMRVKLTPTFTSGKMKMMFQILSDCAIGLRDIMEDSVVTKKPVDIKDVSSRFTIDTIGSVAFGLDCNSLKDPNANFRKWGRRIFEVRPIDRLNLVLILTMPHSVLDLMRFRFNKRDVEEFFMKTIQETVNYREQNNVYRKDFIQLLLEIKKNQALTMDELTAQAFMFYLAGFETSSTTMTFALYSLAYDQSIQEKLRNEINTVLEKHNGELSYNAIMDMHYMDQVIDETLRKYPPVQILQRGCSQNYTIPGTNIEIKKGTQVAIPIFALHMDPDYYPDPEKFDPERFSEENKKLRPSFTWLPFGEGPRVCIGLRFGLMQTKVGLTALLQNYKVRLNARTEIPIKMEPGANITAPKGGVWLDVEKIK